MIKLTDRQLKELSAKIKIRIELLGCNSKFLDECISSIIKLVIDILNRDNT